MSLLDWEQFLERVERNEVLAFELAEDLLQCIDGRLTKLSDAFDSMLPKSIEQSAHALRGLVSPYCGRELLAELKRVEEAARAGFTADRGLPLEISRMISLLKAELSLKLSESKPSEREALRRADS